MRPSCDWIWINLFPNGIKLKSCQSNSTLRLVSFPPSSKPSLPPKSSACCASSLCPILASSSCCLSVSSWATAVIVEWRASGVLCCASLSAQQLPAAEALCCDEPVVLPQERPPPTCIPMEAPQLQPVCVEFGPCLSGPCLSGPCLSRFDLSSQLPKSVTFFEHKLLSLSEYVYGKVILSVLSRTLVVS